MDNRKIIRGNRVTLRITYCEWEKFKLEMFLTLFVKFYVKGEKHSKSNF